MSMETHILGGHAQFVWILVINSLKFCFDDLPSMQKHILAVNTQFVLKLFIYGLKFCFKILVESLFIL